MKEGPLESSHIMPRMVLIILYKIIIGTIKIPFQLSIISVMESELSLKIFLIVRLEIIFCETTSLVAELRMLFINTKSINFEP